MTRGGRGSRGGKTANTKGKTTVIGSNNQFGTVQFAPDLSKITDPNTQLLGQILTNQIGAFKLSVESFQTEITSRVDKNTKEIKSVKRKMED